MVFVEVMEESWVGVGAVARNADEGENAVQSVCEK